MAVREILKHPHPGLQRIAERVSEFDVHIERLIEDLHETLESAGGIGLSATQINERYRVLVIVPTDDTAAPRVYINPEIQAKAAWGLVEESCLSVPGVIGHVFRATKVQVTAQDECGTPFECVLEGMDAVCLQHEIDHLDGKLFTDRLPFFEKCRLQLKSLLRPSNQELQNH